MIRRFKKENSMEFFNFHGYLEGPIFAYGRTGSGKSVSLLSMMQMFQENYGYKIIDLDGGPRNENLYWTLPSQDRLYWARFNKIGRFDEEGPKQYHVNLLYPYFKSKFPKKLPKKEINGEVIINSIPFTIPLKSVTKEDISVAVGPLSSSSIYVWNEIMHDAKKTDNAGSLMGLSKRIKGIGITPIYKNFISQMVREDFLASEYCDYNLDLISEVKNQNVVSVLCLDFVPKEFHMFILNWISRNLCDLLDRNKIPKKNLCLIREGARYFRATDDSVVEDRFKIFRSNLAEYIRMGRRGMYFAVDCQSASETKGIVSGSDDFSLMFRITSARDKRELTDELVREKRMKPLQVGDLAFLDKGQCYICETGQRTVKKVQIRMPRTMFCRKEYGNFYKNVWERFGGTWKNTQEVDDNINKMVQEMVEKYKKEEEERKEKKEDKRFKAELSFKSETNKKPERFDNLVINDANDNNKEIKIVKIKRSVFS